MSVRLKASARVSAEELLAMLLLNDERFAFERQYPYAPPRKLAADFLVWARPTHDQTIENGVLVEIQGGVYSKQAHGSVTGVLADIDRLNQATLHGWRMLRFTPAQVESGEALTTIERALKVSA